MPGPSSRVPRAPRHETGLPTIDFQRVARVRISSTVTEPFKKARGGATIPSLASAANVKQELERFGPYVIHEQLGAGGMASVHRAEHLGVEGFAKQVALKRMLTHLTEDNDFVHSFVHEAQIVSRLRHPNIAQAYDLGRIGNTYYIAMELVPGPTLAQVIRRARAVQRAVPLEVAVEILIQLCDALEHAHDLCDESGKSLDLIHRDISPGNVILSTTGVVKLIDFGICKDSHSRAATAAGIIKGKHAYVAPEYTYGSLDRRADLFGLGVIAHELLTGQRLFLADNEFQTLRNVREMEVSPPSRKNRRVPSDLDDIVMTGLQRDPALRWQNAGAMRIALTNFARSAKLVASARNIREFVDGLFGDVRGDSGSEYSLDIPEVSADVIASGSDPALSMPSIEIVQEVTPVQRPRRPSRPHVEEPSPPAPAPARPATELCPTVPRALPIGAHIARRRRARTERIHGFRPWLVLVLLAVIAAGATIAAARLGVFDARSTYEAVKSAL